jgi:hypothetical protein
MATAAHRRPRCYLGRFSLAASVHRKILEVLAVVRLVSIVLTHFDLAKIHGRQRVDDLHAFD